jgi:hypothetical protein
MARKAVAPALLALCTATGLLARGVAPAAAVGCPNVDVPAAKLTLPRFDDSVFCLINRRRAEHGLRRLHVCIVGENLRWSTPDTNSPGVVVEMWMESSIHRMYLLKPRFNELGVAGARGTPLDPNLPDGITVASEFGFRKR